MQYNIIKIRIIKIFFFWHLQLKANYNKNARTDGRLVVMSDA